MVQEMVYDMVYDISIVNAQLLKPNMQRTYPLSLDHMLFYDLKSKPYSNQHSLMLPSPKQ